jgi:hypothetical protein
MRAIPVGLAITASLAFALAFGADPTPDTKAAADAAANSASAQQQPAGNQKDTSQKDQASHKTAAAKSGSCIKSTGSRIPLKPPEECRNVPGRTYNQDELRNTGETNTAAALRRLDPSFH